MNEHTIDVRVWARPKRVAFVLQRGPSSIPVFEDFQRFAMEQWGAHEYVVVPTDGVSISCDWWNLLEYVDPDSVMLIGTFAERLIEEVHERLQPSECFFDAFKNPASERQAYHYSNCLPGIKLSAAANYIRTFVGNTVPIALTAELFATNPELRSFCYLNFGIMTEKSFRSIFPEAFFEPNIQHATDEKSLLKQILSVPGRHTYPADVLGFGLPVQFNHANGRELFEAGFHLVIGDSLEDYIYCWNRRAIRKPFQIRDTFWLPSHLVEDDEFLGITMEWFHNLFFEESGGSPVRVLSYSIDSNALDNLARKLSKLSERKLIPTKLVANEFPVDYTDVGERYIGSAPYNSKVGPQTSRSIGDVFKAPIPTGLSSEQMRVSATWAIDIQLGHPQPGPTSSFFNESLALPFRSGVANRFFRHHSPISRVTKEGFLSTFVSMSDRVVNLSLCSQKQLFDVILQEYGITKRPNSIIAYTRQTSQFKELRESRAGRSLQGLLSICGGLEPIVKILNDGFWLAMIHRMLGKDLHVQIEDALARAMRENADTALVAQKITEVFIRHHRDSEILSQIKLETAWSRFTSKDKLPFPREVLDQLLASSFLLQGRETRCPKCTHLEWRTIDDLRSRVQCRGCLHEFAIGSGALSFRLNSLVYQALRLQGTQNVIETLEQLRSKSREHFLFLPCQDIFERHQLNKEFSDLDVAVIRDRKYIIGEVKSGPAGLKSINIEKMVRLGVVLRPDLFVFAAPSEAFDAIAVNHLETLENELLKCDVKTERIHLKWTPATILGF